MEMLKGKQLLNKSKKFVSTEEVLKKKKIIVFYFSALWCIAPDCGKLLAALKEIYKESIKRNCGLEIIFVSSDVDEDGFDKYFKKQGQWYAVPFNEELSEQLRRIFGITNVPNLIVCKDNGDIITKCGRQEVVDKGINVLVTWTD